MNEMVERVARAIALAHDASDNPPDNPLLWWGDHARAAIAAMREPGWEIVNKLGWTDPEQFMRFWQAMIDAALKDEP